MAIGRQARRQEQLPRLQTEFAEDVDAALQVLDLLDRAWHDCYSVTPREAVVEDVFFTAQGDLSRLIDAAHLAVQDWRDLRVRADLKRKLCES